MRRLVISDLHLGSFYSNDDKILNLLQNEKYDELILAGDVIDFIRLPQFKKGSLDILNFIIQSECPVIYIIGNHEYGLKNFIGNKLLNINFLKRYEFTDNEKKFRIEHGDDYDSFYIKWEYFICIVCIISDFIERYLNIDILKYYTNLKSYNSNKNDIINKNSDVDVIIVGHTHQPDVVCRNVNVNGNNKTVEYINTGDWIENTSYVIIDNGNVKLNF